ncbi:hypothetical protein [Nocardia cyriacigeorgica]|uniref:hypothetical protein n=1 Tax=Nocardia cyriacigeorgica TaxID=135487 RepID=UPI001E4AEA75|nr:hypothetical protein [Nocardia cyriacigeorgica]
MSTKDTDPAATDAVNELSIAVERTETRSRGTAAPSSASSATDPVAEHGSESAVVGAPAVTADASAGEQDAAATETVQQADSDPESTVAPALSKQDRPAAPPPSEEATTPGEPPATRIRPLGKLTAMVGRRGGQRPTARVLAARCAVVVLLVAAAASTLYFYLQDRDKDAVLDAQEQARQAACEYAPVLANYDAKNLDPYFRAVLDGATGDWRQQFEATSQELRDVLAQGQVVSAASDVQCAIKSGDQTSAEAIVVIGQTITSLGTQGQPAPGQLSMVMRMEKSGDRWLVNDMNAPLAPSPQP